MIRDFLRLPIITPFPPGMTAAGSANFSLEALMSNANSYAEANVTIVTAGADTTLTTAQLLAKNIVLTIGASGAFTITLPGTSKILDALGPTMPRDGSFYFPLYISNRATGFTGTVTAGDSATTFAGPATVDDNANGKWIIRVNAPVSASAHPTLTVTRISTCDAGGGGGGGGTGTLTSVTATTPIVVTPSPITTTGVVSHAVSGVTAGTYGNSTNVPQVVVNATGHVTSAINVPISGAAGGTVTSVAQTVPVEFAIAGSPITSAGTLAITKQTQTANTVWAGPTTGAAAQPTFRALVSADIPVNNFGTVAVSGQSDVVADSPSDTLTLVAGANVTLTTTPGSDSVTIAASGGATNSFETIAVAGQSNVVADSPTDTLTLVAGTNTTITTNASTDTITITATGGGFLQSARLTGTTTWSVPASVSAVWVTMVGGGGGGATAGAAATPGGGGGSGEMLEGELMLVAAGGTVSYSVPTAAATDTNGGDTTFGILTCRGGKKGITTTGGQGGGANGGAGGVTASPGNTGSFGTSETALFFGGSGGGAAGNATGANGGPGGGSGGNITGGAGGAAGGGNGGGGGGAASIYGVGGAGGAAGAAGTAASSTAYGTGGGGGSGTAAGGPGAPGDILVSWVG